MDSKRINPSNQLSKECIVSALLQLIKDKPLSTISVSELCSKAGVSRMTFYRNYESIEDIFIKHLDDIFEKYKSDDTTTNTIGIYYDEEHLHHYFDYLYTYRVFLDGLMLCGLESMFLNKLNNYVIEKWEHVDNKYTLVAFVGVLHNMFHLWSHSNYTENKDILIKNIYLLFYK